MIAEGKQLWIVVKVDMLQVTKVLENIWATFVMFAKYHHQNNNNTNIL